MDEIDLYRDDAETIHKIWLGASQRQNEWCSEVRRFLNEQRVTHAEYARRTGQSESRFDRVLHGGAILRLEDLAAFELYKNGEL